MIGKFDFVEVRNSALWEIMAREWGNNPQMERKYFQKTCLMKDSDPKYTENS